MIENAYLDRRSFMQGAAVGAAAALAGPDVLGAEESKEDAARKRPNVVFVFADQWRAQATGYAGDANARTPNLDRLREESVDFGTAVSTCPVCTPYRASLMTGQYPLTHGAFLNDVCLSDKAVSVAEAFNAAGYETGYIGKWHLDGHGRSSFIPRERRQGFQFWKALECTHNYNRSPYYGDENVKRKWEGYDAIAQTQEAKRYIRDHAGGKPFALFLSWGPPHNPFGTAPAKYKEIFEEAPIALRPNVPEAQAEGARRDLRGYYAHCAALDDCVGELERTLAETGLAQDTVFVFTSDHGDMLGSQGHQRKQRPWDESIRVPFLLRYPAALGPEGRRVAMPIGTPDIMPTLLGLCGVEVPETVEGTDYSALVRGEETDRDGAALIMCPSPFGEWVRAREGKEYRGVRTRRYTYVRDLKGPWLLYDNEADPYQLENLCGRPEHAALQRRLETLLTEKLEETGDGFLPGQEYVRKWGYKVDKNGTVPYTG